MFRICVIFAVLLVTTKSPVVDVL